MVFYGNHGNHGNHGDRWSTRTAEEGATAAMPDTPPVRLIVPGTPGYLRLARLAASGMGAVLGLTVERVEMVRAAVDAVGTSLIEAGQGRPVKLDFRVHQDVLEVTGSTRRATRHPPDTSVTEINHLTLSLVSRSFETTETNGDTVVRVEIPLHDQT
jgi:hypothetical protein